LCVQPSNILLDGRDRALLADVGLAKEAAAGAEAQTHFSTRHVQGTAGYLDPLITNGLQHSTLTDGYAMGITMLVALTGQSAIGLKKTCKALLKHPQSPEHWRAPGVPDAAAGAWPADVVAAMAAMTSSLTLEDEDERMPLSQALHTLEGIVGDEGKWEATADDESTGALGGRATVGSGAEMAPVAEEEEVEEPRECILCMSAPRSVRFLCGHR
jgi:serine/threonine protein kinase